MELKNNQDNIYIRDLLIGVRSFFKDQITWKIKVNNNIKDIKVPVFLSMTGDERFLNDAFVDDFPDQRVELNVDQKQRIIIIPKTWSLNSNSKTNPNVWISKVEEIDEKLKQILVQMAFVEFEIELEFKMSGASSNDIFIMFQKIVEKYYINKYFNFVYNRIPIIGTLIMPTNNETNIPREFGFKDDSTITMSLPFKVKSMFPIYNPENSMDATKKTIWTAEIYEYIKND